MGESGAPVQFRKGFDGRMGCLRRHRFEFIQQDRSRGNCIGLSRRPRQSSDERFRGLGAQSAGQPFNQRVLCRKIRHDSRRMGRKAGL